MKILYEYEIVDVENLSIEGYDNAIKAKIKFHHLNGEVEIKMLDIRNPELWNEFNRIEYDCNKWFNKLTDIDELLNMGISGWVIPVNYEPILKVLDDKETAYISSLYIAILYKAVFIFDDIAEKGNFQFISNIKKHLFCILDYLRTNKNKTLLDLFEFDKEAEKAYNDVSAIKIIAKVFEKHEPFRHNEQMQEHFQKYFQSTLLESAVTNGINLSSCTTLYLREWVSGMSWSHGMNNANVDINGDFYYQKYIAFQLCWRLTNQYVAFANDILSCAKEYRDGIKLNVVLSEMEDSKANMITALKHSSTLLNKIFDDYFACKKILFQTIDQEDRDEIDKLCILLEGAFSCPIWHFCSPRYNIGVSTPSGQIYKELSNKMDVMRSKSYNSKTMEELVDFM